MTVYTTLNDALTAGEENPDDQVYVNQNTGYFVTPQPVGAGVYVLGELKATCRLRKKRPGGIRGVFGQDPVLRGRRHVQQGNRSKI